MARLAQHEIIRQLLHLAQVWLVVVVIIFGMKLATAITVAGLFMLFLLEKLRPRPPAVNLWKNWLLNHVVREQEQNKYQGARMLFYGALLVMLAGAALALHGWLPRPAAITAIVMALIMLTVGDSFSAIIGQTLNGPTVLRRHISGGLGFILAGAIAAVSLGLSWPLVLVVGAAAAITELVTPRQWDDNLTIPAVSFALTILFLI